MTTAQILETQNTLFSVIRDGLIERDKTIEGLRRILMEKDAALDDLRRDLETHREVLAQRDLQIERQRQIILELTRASASSSLPSLPFVNESDFGALTSGDCDDAIQADAPEQEPPACMCEPEDRARVEVLARYDIPHPTCPLHSKNLRSSAKSAVNSPSVSSCSK